MSNIIQQLEAEKSRSIRETKLRKSASIAAGLLCVITAAFLVMYSDFNSTYTIITAIGVIIGLIMWVIEPGIDYYFEVKSQLFHNVAKFYGDFEYNYLPRSRIHELKNAGIFPPFDLEYSEDHFSGLHKKKQVEFFNCTLSKKPKDLRHRKHSYDDVYRAVTILLKLDQEYKGRTIICNYREEKPEYPGVVPVDLTNTKVHKALSIYTSNEEEAERIIASSLLDKILDLKKEYRSNNFTCSIFDNTLLVSLEYNQDVRVFEANSGGQYDLEKDAKAFLKDFFKVMKVVDLLSEHREIEKEKNSTPENNLDIALEID